MKKKAVRNTLIAVGILILCITGVVLTFAIRGGEVKKSLFYPFSYTVYSDRVVLNKYVGSKEVVKIPEKMWGRPVVAIGSYCFEFNPSIKKIVLSDNVLYISYRAFANCSKMEEVVGGKNIVFIEDCAFSGCEKLSNIGQMGEQVEEIGYNAFAQCGSLTWFPATKHLKVLRESAFWGTGIEQMEEIPNLEFMGDGVFDRTPWLEAQKEEYVIYSGYLIGYNGTGKKAVIPNGIKGIAINDFGVENKELEEVYVPSTVTYIPCHCFLAERELAVYIPEQVERLGWDAPKTEIVSGEWIECEDARGSREKELFSGDSNGVIITTSGSPAEAYAKEFGYQCEIVEGW